MTKKKNSPSVPKKVAQKKPLNSQKESAISPRQVYLLLVLGDGLRGSSLVGKVQFGQQERLELLGLPILDDSMKERLQKLTGKAAFAVSGQDLSQICFALWNAIVDLHTEQRGRLASLATRVMDWILNRLNEIARQHADSDWTVSLSRAQRRVIAEIVPSLADRLLTEENKPRKVTFTLGEWNHILQAALAGIVVTESGVERNSLQNIIITLVRAISEFAGPVSIPRSERVFQIKITLVGSNPPIWRRMHIKDVTLDKLHEYIQTAMGWTNSHLHHFRVGEQLYGDPELMQENFAEMSYQDSTTTKLSDILPESDKPFRFQYEYDFGDSWEHEILVEKLLRAEPKTRYPLCLEGARACPPEDVGGIWGYADFLAAIRNPEDERHDELLDWVGGRFAPEAFDPVKATKRIRKGLPDWRNETW